MIKNNAMPCTSHFYWVFGFSVIILYGHTFATNAITAGIDYYYISRIMGHNSISITLDTYTDFMPDKSRAEMQKLEGILTL